MFRLAQNITDLYLDQVNTQGVTQVKNRYTDAAFLNSNSEMPFSCRPKVTKISQLCLLKCPLELKIRVPAFHTWIKPS